MSIEEKKEILKMVAEGKITAEEAEKLLEALEADDMNAQEEAIEAEASQYSTSGADEDLNAIADKVRSYWRIPLWVGIGITIFSAIWMLMAMQSAGMGFWFYCSWVPFFLGVLIIALVAGGRKSYWLFVHVKQAPGESPENINIGFPLPLRLTAWIVRNFGRYIPNMENVEAIEKILESFADTPAGEAALIVDVKEDDGEEVQVFVG